MIAFVANGFEREPDLLLTYQEKLSYFLVDEFQDTNASQNAVVDLLASFWGDQANIFVVGDPHQSIYRFQGASLENTLTFVARYPEAKVISLEIGYRCPQSLYTAASAVIQQNFSPAETDTASATTTLFTVLAKPLQSSQPDGKKIQIYQAPSSTMEIIFLA